MLERNEIIKLACDDSAVETLLQKDKPGLEEMLGPDFAEMKDYDQDNPHHCYDLLKHTVLTVTGIKKDNIDDDDFINLRIAALFHDIGKPAVRTFDEKAGVSRYKGHPEKSAEIAEPLLDEIALPGFRKKQILFYIKNHDIFMDFRLPDEEIKNGQPVISKENVIKTLRKRIDLNRDLPSVINMITLCTADAEAQNMAMYQKDGNNVKIIRLNKIKIILEDMINE